MTQSTGAADLKRIYACATVEEVEHRLTEFKVKSDKVSADWTVVATQLVAPDSVLRLFAGDPQGDLQPKEVPVGYANAIESVSMSLRMITKNRDPPSDEALLILFYLALRNISKKWTMPIRNWTAALDHLTIQFEERLPQR